MLHNFGKLHSVPRTAGMTDYQVNFIADNPARSLITLTIVADDISIIEFGSFGRIVEAFVERFESLSETGSLSVVVLNTGQHTSVFNVRRV